jgi:hypothetical protein
VAKRSSIAWIRLNFFVSLQFDCGLKDKTQRSRVERSVSRPWLQTRRKIHFEAGCCPGAEQRRRIRKLAAQRKTGLPKMSLRLE